MRRLPRIPLCPLVVSPAWELVVVDQRKTCRLKEYACICVCVGAEGEGWEWKNGVVQEKE